VGAGNCVTLCDLRVFVDQAAEPVPAQNARTGDAGGWLGASLSRAKNSLAVPDLQFFRWLCCSVVLADQAPENLPALDPGGKIDHAAGPAQRGFLVHALVRTVAVVVPGVFG
jgi:hypothetical protein